MILAELVEDDREKVDPEVVAVLARMGGWDAFELLSERTPPMPEEFRQEFEYLVEDEPPALVLESFAGADAAEPAAAEEPVARPARRSRRARQAS